MKLKFNILAFAATFIMMLAVTSAVSFHMGDGNFSFNPVATSFGITSAFAGIEYVAKMYFGFQSFGTGFLMAGVNKEIWIDKIKERFYPDDSFLLESDDWTEFVEFNTINFADAGADPDVLINNNTYPIDTVQRTDTGLTVVLDVYDTKNTLVRNVEEVEAAYNKMESVVRGHRNSLRKRNAQKAAHAYGPSTNTASTPVLLTSGDDDGTGRARLKFADILALKTKFDLQDYDMEGRILLMHPTHVEDLHLDDTIGDYMKSQLLALKAGTVQQIAGFKVYTFTSMPVYNQNTLAKTTFGTALGSGKTNIVTLAWLKSEVMRADGTYEMFSRLKDPEQRGDIIGFQKRFIALPQRAKGLGAIVSGIAEVES